jgi:hypothetical protein
MPGINIDTSALEAAVTDAEGVQASVVAFIEGFSSKISDAVAAALAADDAADQGSVDSANAAIAGVTDRVKAVAAGLAAAINTNPTPA